MPLERVPAAQKRIVQAARERARPVIVATQVLESMRSAPRPTRAEVTDAAHAVDEGADAIMLAGETAVGKYPVEAVSTLDRILREAERTVTARDPVRLGPAIWSAHGHALCEAAVALAARAGADAIVAVTEGGRTARMLSALRPHARIIAATPGEAIAARLALHWGVLPVVTPGTTFAAVRDVLLDRGVIRRGASVVFVSMDADLGREDANYVHVEKTR
jgi:pyruvate kinase